jgi:6-pyruvoyltetrahydropterin/6-carboxytetrahydropterin synthase
LHSITLTHTTETGHRIPGHQNGKGKCARLHGHSYRFEVTLAAEVLEGGFVADFGDVKALLDEWDHRMLLWDDDPLVVMDGWSESAREQDLEGVVPSATSALEGTLGVLRVPFIPTAENMAEYLARRMVNEFDTVMFAEVQVYETTKTCASFYAGME